jgi:hypothetical protein
MEHGFWPTQFGGLVPTIYEYIFPFFKHFIIMPTLTHA